MVTLFQVDAYMGESPATKFLPSLEFVWAPARPFFLMKKHDSAVRFPSAKQVVALLRSTN